MHLGPVRREHAPLCCPFTPQIWAAQLLLNVYSSGNWLHPVKVQVTSHPKPPPAPSSAAAPLLFHHFSHLPFPHSAFQTWIASAISLRFGSEVGQTIKAPPSPNTPPIWFKVSLWAGFVCQGCVYDKKRVQKATCSLHCNFILSGFCTPVFPFRIQVAMLSLFTTTWCFIWHWWSCKILTKSLCSLSNYNGLSIPPLQHVHRAEWTLKKRFPEWQLRVPLLLGLEVPIFIPRSCL